MLLNAASPLRRVRARNVYCPTLFELKTTAIDDTVAAYNGTNRVGTANWLLMVLVPSETGKKIVSAESKKILDDLGAVSILRTARDRDPEFGNQVSAVKAFQHQRFAKTYSDLSQQPRYARGVQFFLSDLYGPIDFSERDHQFARVVPSIVRLFPAEIVRTVSVLSALHALSEQLDSEMAEALGKRPIDKTGYAWAWREVGKPEKREAQIDYMMQVGLALDRLTRKTLLRHSLKLMRLPADRAGLGALQSFLESGFDTFRDLGGARDFLQIVAYRERHEAEKLFSGVENDEEIHTQPHK